MELKLFRVERFRSLTLIDLLFLLWLLDDPGRSLHIGHFLAFMLLLHSGMHFSIDVFLQHEIRCLLLFRQLQSLCLLIIIEFNTFLTREDVITALLREELFVIEDRFLALFL